MMKKAIGLAPLLALLVGSGGCSNTVRYMTTMNWLNAPSASAPGAVPAAAEGSIRTFYATYWEGTCFSGILGFGKGCSVGDSKIRRCNAKPDNTLECVDEPEANQAFARNKK